MKTFVSWCFIGLLTAIASVFAAGSFQNHSWSGRELANLADGAIHADGWMEERAELRFAGFSGVANYVEFVFNPWRPAGTVVAQVEVSVCDGAPQLLTITSKEPVRVGLKGNCSPRSISLRGLNPFVPSGGADDRQLTVQIDQAHVSSRLGVPLVDFSTWLEMFSALAVLVVLGAAAVRGRTSIQFGAAILVLSGAVATIFSADVSPDKFLPLWIFTVAVLGGMAIWPIVSSRVEATDHRGSLLLVCGVVLFGGALRFWGISFGLPANFHPDEVPKVNAIMRMVDQDTWNPQYFLHPSLLLYSTYLTNVLLQAIGIEGTFRETAFLAGRVVSATAGTLSVALTYGIGRRLFSRPVGIWAALLLAVFPLHVTCSRYLKEDALLTFVVLSCVFTTVCAVQGNRRPLLLVAGLLAGMTAGTKYSGILMAAVPASAPWLVSRRLIPNRSWLPWAVVAVLIAPCGFLMTTPFAVLDFAKFSKDFAAESHHMQTGHTQTIDAWSQLWMYHFWRSIIPGMTWFVAVVSIVGAGMLARRARLEDLCVLGVILLFYLPAEYVKAKPAPQPERYILPCLPFLAMAGAELLRVIGSRVSSRVGFSALAAVAVALPLSRTVSLAREVRFDTRDMMAQWMDQNVPKGAKVLMDWKPYCPRFMGEEFNVEYIPRARIIPELDVRVLKNSGADYLVLSSLFYNRYFSQPESNPVLRQRIREVFERVPVVIQFAPKSGTYGFHNPVLTLFSLRQEDFAKLEQELVLKREGRIAATTNDMRASAKW